MDATPPAAPEPPWWSTGRGKATRSSLTRSDVVAAAMRVLDAEGLAGFTMRRVADELGTGAATLYWHVTDKDQLLDLVLDRYMAEIELPTPDPQDWEGQVRTMARSARAMFRRHPAAAQLSFGRIPAGPSLIRLAEWMLAVLRGAGIADRPAAWFADLLALVGTSLAVEEAVAAHTDDRRLQALGAYFASLPPEDFPNLAATAAEMAGGSPDDRFEFALDLLIRGLEVTTGPP